MTICPDLSLDTTPTTKNTWEGDMDLREREVAVEAPSFPPILEL